MILLIKLEKGDVFYLNMNNVTDILIAQAGRSTMVHINYTGGKPRSFSGENAELVIESLEEWGMVENGDNEQD